MQDFLERMKAKPQVRTQKTVMLPKQSVARRNSMVATRELERTLECDGIIAHATCLRYYGRWPSHKGIWTRTLDYIPINRRDIYARVTSYQHRARRKLGHLRLEQIQHLLGVAEMRGMLGVDATEWDSEAGRLGARMRPDAVWNSPLGEVAIEFDTGSYRRSVVWKKIQRFERDYPAGIVWGVTDPKRAERMQISFPGVQMMSVDFFTMPGKIPNPYWTPGETQVNPPDYRWVITVEQHEAMLCGIHVPLGQDRGPTPGEFPYPMTLEDSTP